MSTPNKYRTIYDNYRAEGLPHESAWHLMQRHIDTDGQIQVINQVLTIAICIVGVIVVVLAGVCLVAAKLHT